MVVTVPHVICMGRADLARCVWCLLRCGGCVPPCVFLLDSRAQVNVPHCASHRLSAVHVPAHRLRHWQAEVPHCYENCRIRVGSGGPATLKRLPRPKRGTSTPEKYKSGLK